MRRSPAPRGPNWVRTLHHGRRQLIWLILTWGRVCGGTRRELCGSRWLPAGGTCWKIRQCTGMSLGDEFLGIDMGCGCFFLVAGRRAWYWGVRLSDLPSCSKASRGAAGFQVVSCPSLCNDRCRSGAELESLFMRQSMVALERISCISCSRCSYLEIWRIVPPGFVSGSHTCCVWVLLVEF